MLKTKSAGTQILLVVSVTLATFFLLSLLGTVILGLITGMSLLEISDPAKWDLTDPDMIFLLRGMQLVQFISLFVVPVWISSWMLGTNHSRYLGLRSFHIGYLIAGIAAMIIAIPFVNWMGELNRQVQFPPGVEAWMKQKEEEATLMVRALLSRRTVWDLFLNLFFIAVLAAVGEELLFRGLLQRLFIKWFKSPWAGIFVAAFLFSAMHVQFYGFLPRFLLGVILGLMYWYSGSLWVAIIAHFVYDAALIILSYFYPEMLNDETTVQVSNLAVAGIISLGLTVLLIYWMKKRSVASYQAVYADDKIAPYN